MKTVKIIIVLLATISPTYFFGQNAVVNSLTKKEAIAQKFDVTIIHAAGPDENKLGVSITDHNDDYQYTFQWKVDGKPAGHLPIAKAKDGQQIELMVTRYPGAEQSTTTLRMDTPDKELPLFPKKRGAKGLLANN